MGSLFCMVSLFCMLLVVEVGWFLYVSVDVELRGGAMVYWFSFGSVWRVLDVGWFGD